MTNKLCFSKRNLVISFLGLLFFSLLFVYLVYTVINKKEPMSNVDLLSNLSSSELKNKMKNLQNSLHSCNLDEQKCQSELYETKKLLKNQNVTESSLLNKIYNPLVSPNRYYPGGRLNQKAVLSYDDYQQIGFIFKDNERYPLFGRYKYPGRSDRWEYYIMDETRNRLKIPFESRNDQELYDNDNISITGLGNDYMVKIYDYETFRYNPNLY